MAKQIKQTTKLKERENELINLLKKNTKDSLKAKNKKKIKNSVLIVEVCDFLLLTVLIPKTLKNPYRPLGMT